MCIRIRVARLAICIAIAAVGSPSCAWERMMAYHDTVVAADEERPMVGLVSYDKQHWLNYLLLGKLAVGIEWANGTVWLHQHATLAQSSWGLHVDGTCGPAHIRLDAAPLLVRSKSIAEHIGGAVIRLRLNASQPCTMRVRFGGLGRTGILTGLKRQEWLRDESFAIAPNDQVECAGSAFLLRSPADGIPLAVAGMMTPETSFEGVTPNLAVTTISMPAGGHDYFLSLGFARQAARARAIAAGATADPAGLLERARRHYETAARVALVETPLPEIDSAFRAALLNLEYTWYPPMGWIESLHHWDTLYTQLHAMAADCVGQPGRARESLLFHARRLRADGRVMDFDPSGRTREDFPWNQYFMWGVKHHWRWTGERAAAAALFPAAERVVEHTLRTWDKDGNLLLGFGQQIGYQEDYISTPDDGASPTIAGIEMFRTLAELAHALNQPGKAREYHRDADLAASRLRASLWRRDLGRFIYYKDRLGVAHLEGQYHTFGWPALYGITNLTDSYTSAHHIIETLSTPRGLIYCSNNFPGHPPHTTGCQEGSVQSPFAAMALARIGEHDRAAQILAALGRLVIEPPNRGAFPEVAEKAPTWFSPAAAAYLQGVVEGLFGIEMDVPAGRLWLRPALPDSWPQARFSSPQVALTVRQSARERSILARFDRALGCEIRWNLPVSDILSVRCNGSAVPFSSQPGIGHTLLSVSLPPAKRFDLRISLSPRPSRLVYPREVAPGGDVTIRAERCRIAGLLDPEALAERTALSPREARIRLRSDLLQPYLPFGQQARLFSDRTLFLSCRSGNADFLAPVNFRLTLPSRCEPGPPPVGNVAALLLPRDLLTSSASWREWRWYSAFGHYPWAALGDPLESAPLKNEIVEPVAGLRFRITPGQLALASAQRGEVLVPINASARRIYLLILPALTNDDVFSQVGEVVAQCRDGIVRRPLFFPGDLDWAWPPEVVGDYATVGKGWSCSPAWHTPSAVLSTVSLDLGGRRFVNALRLRTIGQYPALGLLGVSLSE